MGVKFNLKGPGLSSLTSPPGEPNPKPDGKLFTTVKAYADRKVYVSLPFPDSIELTCTLLNEHTAQPDISYKSKKAIYQELDTELSGYLGEVTMADVDNVTIGKQNKSPARRSVTFDIRYNPADPLDKAFYTLTRSVEDGLGIWRARLEFSVRRAGPDGLARIREAVNGIFSFQLDHMLPDMRVARMDAAIDFIGVEPLDLIGHAPNEGKRQIWLGDHGRPESVYIFEKKKALTKPPKIATVKTQGPHRLTLYERTAYEIQRGFLPTYGKTPVTRAEVSKRWTKSRPHLKNLPTIANMLAGRRVAYAPAVRSKPRPWIAFCMAAFGGGTVAPRWYWMQEGGPKLVQDYIDCAGDLLNDGLWIGWEDGLSYTGFSEWISTANK